MSQQLFFNLQNICSLAADCFMSGCDKFSIQMNIRIGKYLNIQKYICIKFFMLWLDLIVFEYKSVCEQVEPFNFWTCIIHPRTWVCWVGYLCCAFFSGNPKFLQLTEIIFCWLVICHSIRILFWNRPVVSCAVMRCVKGNFSHRELQNPVKITQWF